MTSTPSLEGVAVPLLSPCLRDGSADAEGLAANVERLNAAPLVGYLLFGTTGEAPLLSRAEKRAYLTAARPAVPATRALLAATTAEGVEAALEDAELYASHGCDAVLVLTPRYYQPGPAELGRFFRRVAERSPLPVFAYNMPPRTGVDLGEEGVRALWPAAPSETGARSMARQAFDGGDELPPEEGVRSVAGIKESGGDVELTRRVTPDRPPGFVYLTGSARDLAGQLAAGAVGAILAVANVAPTLAGDVFAAWRAGHHQQAAELSRRLARVQEAFARHGIPTLKWVAGELGFAAGPPRLPLQPLDPEQQADVRRRLEELGAELEWPQSASRRR